MTRAVVAWILGIIIVVVLVVVPFVNSFPFFLANWINEYTLHVLIIGFYFAMLASSWSLLMGQGGQFSFAHLAFASVGAYTTGLMGRYLATNALVGIIAGAIMAGIVGLFIGMLVLRLRKTYLALFTIAFAEILRLIISAEKDYTEGPNGLPVEPLFPNGLTLGSYHFDKVDKIPPYFIMLTLLLVTLALMSWMASSRFGLFLRAIREDEEAAAALGVNVVRYKILVFVVTSMVAGLAGAVRAHYVTVIAPNDMIILWMSLVITMSVLGGIESLIASAIGGVVVFMMLEYLRTDFATTAVVGVILAVILIVGFYQLGQYAARRFAGVTFKDIQKAIPMVISVVLGLLVAIATSEPVTAGLALIYSTISDKPFPGKIDMSAWRLVFFGLVLMLTLRFYQNGLLYPIIQYFFRPGTLAETVAKRDAAAEVVEVEVGS